MSVLDIVRTRRTIQRFEPAEVPREAILAAVEAARWAPCHRTTWPWRFVWPGPETRQALFSLGLELQARAKGCPPEAVEPAVRAKMLDPGALLVVVQRLDPDPAIREEDYASCAAAIQNAMLLLHERGLGSKWGTGKVTRHPRALKVLGVDRERERVVGFLWVGRPARVPRPPDRPSVSALLTKLA